MGVRAQHQETAPARIQAPARAQVRAATQSEARGARVRGLQLVRESERGPFLFATRASPIIATATPSFTPGGRRARPPPGWSATRCRRKGAPATTPAPIDEPRSLSTASPGDPRFLRASCDAVGVSGLREERRGVLAVAPGMMRILGLDESWTQHRTRRKCRQRRDTDRHKIQVTHNHMYAHIV